ncbi:2,3-bisphosphoglycerate independent phosphoglycerate mutase [Blattamonas nauphoetae]|uniref:2,3-bisphosphoglycerate independent phosphoglycerate mutase n=1 Tax=Blattamonas nauphoetae TaxID=2049346 RepID=A0ABQ9WLZ1_9EUKA|nr:2,3-bisphosphoglycerate independent phosphoglycerate mutase [Blattamonas nauphoetae]KAK2946551.1 2,3-bisphosphoglycerate independent phosphoglycerate mutase [Blattamonas nauphoetae]
MIIHGQGEAADITSLYPCYFKTTTEAIEKCRQLHQGKKDQCNLRFVFVGEDGKPIGKMEDGDACINTTIKDDRGIKINRVLEDPNSTFTTYLVPQLDLHNTGSEDTYANGITAYIITETHKYGHMTSSGMGQTERHPEMKTVEAQCQHRHWPEFETRSSSSPPSLPSFPLILPRNAQTGQVDQN